MVRPLKIPNFPFETEEAPFLHLYPVVKMTPAFAAASVRRASGDALCPVCGFKLYDHPSLACYRVDSKGTPYEFLDGTDVVNCLGEVLHL